MHIDITTADTEEVDLAQIIVAVSLQGYYVTSAKIRNVNGNVVGEWAHGDWTPPAGIHLSYDQLAAWVGHDLTDEEVEDIAEALPNSSLPEVVDTVAHEAVKVPYPAEWSVSGDYTQTVTARTEEEAIDKACDKIGNGWHWVAVKADD